MKKILLLAVAVVSLMLLSSGTVSAVVGAACTGNADCGPSETCDVGGTDQCIAGSGISGPSECVRLRNNISLKLKNAQGSWVGTVDFQPGATVCSAQDSSGSPARCSDSTPQGSTATCFAEEAGIIVLLNTIATVTSWLFYIITLVVVLMVIYGGFVILTASGDPEKAGKGRSILTYAIIGLAVALLARIIPSVVQFIMGV